MGAIRPFRKRPAPRSPARLPFAIALAGSALASLAPAAASGQDPAVLIGRALDHRSEGPVAAARIELVDEQGRSTQSVVADAEGRFRFERVRPGSYRARASSLGYQTVRTPEWHLAAGDTTDVIIWMDVDAVPLAPLEVVVGRPPEHRHPGLQGLYARARGGLGGNFIFSGEIEERSPTRVTDMFASVGGGFLVTSDLLVNVRQNCVPSVYVDGVRIFDQSRDVGDGLTPPERVFNAVNSVSPFQVEGVELYTGPATVPAEFGGPTAGCGVIAIWLRRG
jgi:hypothetical protein